MMSGLIDALIAIVELVDGVDLIATVLGGTSDEQRTLTPRRAWWPAERVVEDGQEPQIQSSCPDGQDGVGFTPPPATRAASG